MTDVYRYQIYCETEGEWKYVWDTKDNPPTTCPTDTVHTVNSGSVAVVETVSSNDVVIHQPTDGYFMIKGYPINIESTTPGTQMEKVISFTNKIQLWTTDFNGTSDMLGDSFDVIVNADTAAGGLISTCTIGSNIIYASSTVIGNVVPGMYLKVMDVTMSPPNVENLGEVLHVNSETAAVTVSNPPASEFPAGSLLLLNIYLGKDIVIDMEGPYKLVDKGFQGKVLPDNSTLTMVYRNNNGSSKTVNWRIGFYYGSDFTTV